MRRLIPLTCQVKTISLAYQNQYTFIVPKMEEISLPQQQKDSSIVKNKVTEEVRNRIERTFCSTGDRLLQ